jgi:hypothetical protein
MRVLVIGSKGSMGSRYAAIVRYLHHDLIEYDTAIPGCTYPTKGDYDAAIIATPITEHVYYCKMGVADGKPVLCEKPITTSPDALREIIGFCNSHPTGSLYMVNNWAFVGRYREPMSEKYITINTYNTGRDGAHDLIQPLYLVDDVEDLTVVKQSPFLDIEIGGEKYGRDDFDKSYVDMVEAFLDGETGKMWNVYECVEAHERVVEYGQGK